MPYLDTSKNLCGFLAIEEIEGSEKYLQRFFRLNNTNCQLEYFADDPLQSIDSQQLGALNLRFLSAIEDSSELRPNVLHGFYLFLCGQKQFLHALNGDDQLVWINALRESSAETKVCNALPCKHSCSRSSVFWCCNERSANKSGYLIKQGIKRKNWKRRFFVLDLCALSYFTSHDEVSPIKMINLADIYQSRVSVGIHVHKQNVFEVVTPQRVYYIQAESQSERDAWISAINKRCKNLRPSKVTK